MAEPQSRGPGNFVTHRVQPHPSGGHWVANSRRHRKGLRPHRVFDLDSAERPRPTKATAFGHFFAPGRMAWWIGVLFATGATCFTAGGFVSAYPEWAPSLAEGDRLGHLFAVGAVFFTTAAWLQFLEALNGDVAHALAGAPRRSWRWFGWLPHNLGYWASAIQLVGTVMFNFNTLDALLPDLTPQMSNWLIWVPNMIGCACFLTASYLAFAEVSQGAWSFAPASVSWWIAVINMGGSVAFQISALGSFATGRPDEHAFRLASIYTGIGGACFFVGAYLMIPELFDEEEES